MDKSSTDNKSDGPCCATCRFFKTIGQAGQRTEICAYNPPKVTHIMTPVPSMAGGMELKWQSFSGWPVTGGDRWCGKYERLTH